MNTVLEQNTVVPLVPASRYENQGFSCFSRVSYIGRNGRPVWEAPLYFYLELLLVHINNLLKQTFELFLKRAYTRALAPFCLVKLFGHRERWKFVLQILSQRSVGIWVNQALKCVTFFSRINRVSILIIFKYGNKRKELALLYRD